MSQSPAIAACGARRGAALLLAVFAMLVVGTATLAFSASRHASLLVARNASTGVRARELASSGLDLAKAILRHEDTGWRLNHQAGVLLDRVALDGGTVTVTLVDIRKRAAGTSAALSVPDAATTEVEIAVTAEVDGARWTSLSHMSIPQVVKGQYAIFANKLLWIYGTDNVVGRWGRAPKSSEKRRVNIGTQADFAFANFSGVWVDSDVRLESEVLPTDPDDPRTLKSTWVYYPYNGGANLWSATFPVNGPGRDLVATVRMSPEDSIRMVQAPQPSPQSPAAPGITGGNTISGGKRVMDPFTVGSPTGWTNTTLTTNNCELRLTAGTYEVYGPWRANNARIVVEGPVRLVVAPKWSLFNLFPEGINWTNTTVELAAGADLEINNGYRLTMSGCWIGGFFQCLDESDPLRALGDAHRKAWMGEAFESTACDQLPPSEPRYLEPWRVRIYPIRSVLSALFVWNFSDTSVIASIFLPNNTVRFNGHSQVYGRIAADSVFIDGTSQFRYDHALDDIVGLTEGRAPNRGGDPDEMFPVRPLAWGVAPGEGP